jgi:hypothetical protein
VRDGKREPTHPQVLGAALPLRAKGAPLLAMSVLLYLDQRSKLGSVRAAVPCSRPVAVGLRGRSQARGRLLQGVPRLPAAHDLGCFGLLGGSTLAVGVALIWLAHRGMNRTLGVGLK